MAMAPAALCAWRHPKPVGAEGRCIGMRTDLPVDRRKAKRLAHRLRSLARREGLPRVEAVSPLRRCRDVGRWLRRFGFACVVDARLTEFDFGAWDGRRWSEIPRAEIDAWTADLGRYRPGSGECVAELLARVRSVCGESPASLLVTHGGWLSGWLWLQRAEPQAPTAITWPAAPRYGDAARAA